MSEPIARQVYSFPVVRHVDAGFAMTVATSRRERMPLYARAVGVHRLSQQLLEAAPRAFGGTAIIMKKIVCPLRPKTEKIKLLLSEYKFAAFFPMTYSDLNRKKVDCYVVCLMPEVK